MDTTYCVHSRKWSVPLFKYAKLDPKKILVKEKEMHLCKVEWFTDFELHLTNKNPLETIQLVLHILYNWVHWPRTKATLIVSSSNPNVASLPPAWIPAAEGKMRKVTIQQCTEIR